MTIHQWLRHLIAWFHHFPKKIDDDHLWIAPVGGDTEYCWVCGASRHDGDTVCSACRYYPCGEKIVYPDDYWCEKWQARLTNKELLES